MEAIAEEYVKNKEWAKGVEAYNRLLQNRQNSEQQLVKYLLDRAECLHELGNHEAVINDCKNILRTLRGKPHTGHEPRTRLRLIRALFALNRIAEAELLVKEWIVLVKQSPDLGECRLVLETRLERFFNINTRHSFETWFTTLDNLCTKYTLMAAAAAQSSRSGNNAKIMDANGAAAATGNTAGSSNLGAGAQQILCIYCNLTFKDKTELSEHCLTQEHETMIMSDEGHDWHWRAPPRGFKCDSYRICENWKENGGGSCRYGVQCVEAHGEEELLEWKERFLYREMKLKRAKEKELYGKSYTEELLEKWVQTANPKSVMEDKLAGVEDYCSCPLSATVTSKNSNHRWVFTMKTNRPLRAVALLQDTHRNHFFVSKIELNGQDSDVKNNQEWINSNPRCEVYSCQVQYDIAVVFQTTIFGTFRQSVVFDFDTEPILVKHLCVDVVPDSDVEKINEIRKEFTVSIAERWTNSNSEIVPFVSSLVSTGANTDWEKSLKLMYPCPDLRNFVLSNATLSEKKFTRNNYRERTHELLWIEEIERYNLIAQYNLTTRLQIAHSYLLSPNSMAASTAKYSSNGELFASISLGKELSEDTSEGRLILRHCNAVYLYPKQQQQQQQQMQSRKVYEALIEDKGKNMIYLRLSAEMVRDLRLTTDTCLEVQVQFQLNRIPYCEWHYTVDKIPNFKLIFPDTYVEPNIPWSPGRQWTQSFDSRLNLKQKEAVVAITTPRNSQIPPILVIGPFGTGKTFTLAQAIRELIKDDANRILLCTHSNSAADLYIKDYLDKWVEGGDESARPLRIYYQKRWVTTVSPVVQKYCLIELKGNTREFQIPTIEDIEKHKIIVVTLSTSIYLSVMGLPSGYFTHILLDEAAQALECETITPLTLATENTRIVLAGDHMQLGPDIFSKFAKDRNLHVSLLERLYDYYPNRFPCKILLCENYRAHQTIIQFTSESFYDQKLVSSSKQPKHTKFHPLTFFTTRGEDVQDKNSTAFYNNSEVYEVVERVQELKRSWPSDWGEMTDQSIGVVTPYSDQVFRIRSELRKRKIDVCVERVLNVQGKQFRAIILSTVRTRRTCTNQSSATENDVDYGFLSNSKLLNTAITRAQSLVAVVGDPIALCSLGRCSKVWERFIQICNENGSLYGITWTHLKFQLDGIELKKIYSLNPLAPEFIPRKYREQLTQNDAVNNLNQRPAALNQLLVPGQQQQQQPQQQSLPQFAAVAAPTSAQIQNDLRVIPLVAAAAQQQQSGALNLQQRPASYVYGIHGTPMPPPQPGGATNGSVQQQQHQGLVQTSPPQIHHQMPPNGFRPAQQATAVRVINAHEVPFVIATTAPGQQRPISLNAGINPQGIVLPGNMILPGTAVASNNPNNRLLHQQQLVAQSSQHHHLQQQQVSNNKSGQSSATTAPSVASTKLIQFMNNVHFPEAQALNDCINLLPQQMSLADMIKQPPQVQGRWYNYLKETVGAEAAEKFKYLLHTMNQKNSRIADPSILERTTPLSSSSSGSPTFNWYDSPSNQINFNKPVYMREVETCWPDFNTSNPLYKRSSSTKQEQSGNNGLVIHQDNVANNKPQQQQPMTAAAAQSGNVMMLLNGHSRSQQQQDGNGAEHHQHHPSAYHTQQQQQQHHPYQHQLQKRINEDFGNLSLNQSTPVDDLYHLFGNGDSSSSSSSSTTTAAPSSLSKINNSYLHHHLHQTSAASNRFIGNPATLATTDRLWEPKFHKYFS